MATKAQSYAHFDPIEDVRRDLEKAAGPAPDLDTLTDTAASPPSASTPPAATPSASPPAATEAPPAAAPAEPAAPQSTAPVNTPDAGRAA